MEDREFSIGSGFNFLSVISVTVVLLLLLVTRGDYLFPLVYIPTNKETCLKSALFICASFVPLAACGKLYSVESEWLNLIST